MRSSNPSASVFWKSEAEGAPSPKHHDVQPNWRVHCHFYEHSKGMLYRNQPFNIHTTILLMQADEWRLSSGSCRSPDSRERRQCSITGRSHQAIGTHIFGQDLSSTDEQRMAAENGHSHTGRLKPNSAPLPRYTSAHKRCFHCMSLLIYFTITACASFKARRSSENSGSTVSMAFHKREM